MRQKLVNSVSYLDTSPINNLAIAYLHLKTVFLLDVINWNKTDKKLYQNMNKEEL